VRVETQNLAIRVRGNWLPSGKAGEAEAWAGRPLPAPDQPGVLVRHTGWRDRVAGGSRAVSGLQSAAQVEDPGYRQSWSGQGGPEGVHDAFLEGGKGAHCSHTSRHRRAAEVADKNSRTGR
jgi:hypothetical protein